MSAVNGPEFVRGDLGFCSSFGDHAVIPIEPYRETAVALNSLNSIENASTCLCESSLAGCARIFVVLSECCCPDANKYPTPRLFLLSSCIRGLVEVTGLGKAICYIPDRIATKGRNLCDDPTGGLLIDAKTKSPITHAQVKELNLMKRD